MDKCCVFIDCGMLTVLTKNVFTNPDGTPQKVKYDNFAERIVKECGGELLRTYLYTCPPHQSAYPTPDERKRKESFDRFSYSIRQLKKMKLQEGRLRKYYDAQGKPDFVQKGVDVLLAIDMLKLALKGVMQKAILIACDSDFVPVVRALREEGVSVLLYYYKSNDGRNNAFSQELYEECDDRKELTKDHFKSADAENVPLAGFGKEK